MKSVLSKNIVYNLAGQVLVSVFGLVAVRSIFRDLGGDALEGSPADFGKLIAVETDKWAKVIRAGNIKPQ